MTNKKIITGLKQYQGASRKEREKYLKDFEEKMIYRTTKTENPQTTHKIVTQVLNSLA